MISRDRYIKKIRPLINKPVIKVLTGIRRAGKSAMLSLIEDELTGRGIDTQHIIRINFEESRYFPLTDAAALDTYISSLITGKKTYYLLIDEIQEVQSWEKVINSLFASGVCDIYITGSNSRLLSSELSTYLAGRYVEIPVQTLSFAETLDFAEARTGKRPDAKNAFISYLKNGGFPMLHTGDYDADTIKMIANGIYSSAILRDVVQRHNLRNSVLLERLVMFLFDNTGNIFSARSVSDFLKSENLSISPNTIYEYLSMLEEAFVVHRVQRFDMAGKRILKTLEKYYVSDTSLITSTLGFRDTKVAGLLENIVFLELLSRDYKVYVGKSGSKEIDFVAEKSGERIYIQVARIIGSDETQEREFGPLLSIADHYPKYVVTMDELAGGNIDGVKHIHIADFLLMEDFS